MLDRKGFKMSIAKDRMIEELRTACSASKRLRVFSPHPYDDAEVAVEWAGQCAFLYLKPGPEPLQTTLEVYVINHSWEELTESSIQTWDIYRSTFEWHPNLLSGLAMLIERLFLTYDTN